MSKTNAFGYPISCDDCMGHDHRMGLVVTGGYYIEGNELRLMLIGQDPTVDKRAEEVNVPLLLDSKKRNTLRKWLKNEIGIDMDQLTVYATNVVKCTFDNMPTRQGIPALRFLEPFYTNCQNHLKNEIELFKPNVILTFGESAHILFIRLLENYPQNKYKMTKAYDGVFEQAKMKDSDTIFHYSPCLHIKTFRVAITYGDKAQRFKKEIRNILKVK